jgi:predicted N-acyltransferase
MKVQAIQSIAEIAPEQWDSLVGDHNPFIEHAFLLALEQSGSVGEESGWIPCHIVVHRDETLVGALPLYIKTHSYGEYIFDWAWASASADMGLEYYPKLVSAVPFTPATGRRCLTLDGAVSGPVVEAMVSGAISVAESIGASSLHLLFVTEDEKCALSDLGMLGRLTYQFHWENENWPNFDAFVSALRRSSRRNLKRERRQVHDTGLEIRWLSGPQISEEQWDALYLFYQDTVARKGAIPYLQPEFFHLLRRNLSHRVVSAMAFDGDRPVAGTLGFQKGRHLYGRYWGCRVDQQSLHFELCYYQHIEAAIRHGWTRFEAGAQGAHKIKRGLMPQPTWSAHLIFEPKLRQIIANYLPREARHTQHEIECLNARTPFKRNR